MLHYIIQTVAFQLFFLVIYDVFLKKETFFNWNRAYLLATSLLSLVLPFIKVDRFSKVIPEEYVVNLPRVVIGKLSNQKINSVDLGAITVDDSSIWTWQLLLYSGMIIASVILLCKIGKLAIIIHKNPKRWKDNLIIVNLLNSTNAFSFFHYIFLGERISSHERMPILKHEQVHVEQKHTIDLLYFEILRILFWFNPLVYMYQNRMAELHEFIADAKAVKLQDKKDYYENLLSQVFETQNLSFINPFFKKSLIKKRIIMLSKHPSKQKQLFKYILVIPMVFAMLLYTSANAQINNSKGLSEKVTQKKEVKMQTLNDLEVPFAVIEQVPVYPGCEELSPEEQKGCMSKKISEYVSVNFNTKLGDSLGIVGRVKINTIFKVNKEGVVEGIRARAPHPKLEKEAIRIISGLPQMKPGIQKGKSVIVPYSLPIIFQVKGKQVSNSSPAKIPPVYQSVDESIEVPFAIVEQPPVYPGCDSSDNKLSKACTSKKISKYVAKNFNVKLANDLGLVGRQKISVVFKVNKDGNIEGIKARAPHPKLEKETERVISGIPKMKPGMQKGKAVTVPYSLPIIFQIAEDKKSKDKN